jgi:uncharacterized protein YeeX (DUF496 family)
MIKNNPIFQKFEELIEDKINKRNKIAIDLPKNENLVNFLDKEIDTLQELENYIYNIIKKNETDIIAAKKQSFANGVKSGILEATTGRAHPEFLMN